MQLFIQCRECSENICLAAFEDGKWVGKGSQREFQEIHWKKHFSIEGNDFDEDDPELYISQTFLKFIDDQGNESEGPIPEQYWIIDTKHTGFGSEPYIVPQSDRKPNSYFKRCVG